MLLLLPDRSSHAAVEDDVVEGTFRELLAPRTPAFPLMSIVLIFVMVADDDVEESDEGEDCCGGDDKSPISMSTRSSSLCQTTDDVPFSHASTATPWCPVGDVVERELFMMILTYSCE